MSSLSFIPLQKICRTSGNLEDDVSSGCNELSSAPPLGERPCGFMSEVLRIVDKSNLAGIIFIIIAIIGSKRD